MQRGSGHEAFYGEYSDDEDGFSSRGDECDATEYGSGDHGEDEEEDDTIIVPAWTVNKEAEKGDEKWSPWPKNPPTLGRLFDEIVCFVDVLHLHFVAF